MPTSRRPVDRRIPSEALGWFGEFLLALDRGNGVRTAECRRRLARLGFVVHHRPARAKGAADDDTSRPIPDFAPRRWSRSCRSRPRPPPALRRRSVERMQSAGQLPRPDLGIGRMPRWRAVTVQDWIDGQAAGRGKR